MIIEDMRFGYDNGDMISSSSISGINSPGATRVTGNFLFIR
jgi:hypothetical protein